MIWQRSSNLGVMKAFCRGFSTGALPLAEYDTYCQIVKKATVVMAKKTDIKTEA